MVSDLVPKQLQLIRELIPDAKSVAVLVFSKGTVKRLIENIDKTAKELGSVDIYRNAIMVAAIVHDAP